MPDISPQEFQDGAGPDWRHVGMAGCACFRTGSFAAGVAFVTEIGRIADELDHHPEVDLQYGTVTVQTYSHDIMAMSNRDVRLAVAISAAARNLEIDADPAAVQSVQLTMDALVTADVLPFWQAVLGYKAVGDEDLLDPRDRGPSIWFQPMDAPRPQRNRLHLDVFVPNDQAEARIAAALAAGGRLVDDSHAPDWWTLADAEGNEADVATTYGRS